MVAVLERLYLKLGHSSFKNGILVFSNRFERYSHVPILPLSEIDATLNDLKVMNFKNNGGNWLDNYYVIKHPGKTYRSFKLEADIIFKAINDNFSLIKLKKEIPPFLIYKMFPADFNLGRLNKSREAID